MGSVDWGQERAEQQHIHEQSGSSVGYSSRVDELEGRSDSDSLAAVPGVDNRSSPLFGILQHLYPMIHDPPPSPERRLQAPAPLFPPHAPLQLPSNALHAMPCMPKQSFPSRAR
jgi:hypothetical protein